MVLAKDLMDDVDKLLANRSSQFSNDDFKKLWVDSSLLSLVPVFVHHMGFTILMVYLICIPIQFEFYGILFCTVVC